MAKGGIMKNKQIGFIGTGIMGKPMVLNLLKSGFSVNVYNRTASKLKEVIEKGGIHCKTPKDAAKSSDVIITMVSDPHALKDVLFSGNGVLSGINKGSILIDSSTVDPSTTIEVSKALAEKGCKMLDAPVTGSKPAASAGTLIFLIGGEKKVFEKCKSLFEAMGKKFFYVGRQGMGSKAKLVNNLLIIVTFQGLVEGLALAKKSGIDEKLMIEILSNSAARSSVMEFKAPFLLKRDFSPNFPLKLMHKDLSLMMKTAYELNLPLPVAAIVKETVGIAETEGLGDQDFSALLKLYEKWGKFEIKG